MQIQRLIGNDLEMETEVVVVVRKKHLKNYVTSLKTSLEVS